ncbi:MAG: aldo/keto reductase [Agrococcus casei]|uniref:Oxidoreductase of aldo/keto reductase family, subgroup 1 n=2 Tax=Agrococcus TaxID=46352 RepID=A0A1R4F133_9MICO|nr:aldo/keto reductase [Agrococcus casei]SJM49620.1 oxidoreductase of aldo/keto reductase family, subgroup 1 [Agrococcus casei LMG 22410]
MSIPVYRLNDDFEIPAVGFGTAELLGDDAYNAVTSAIAMGYRLFDTAMRYDNEEPVGRAIRDAVQSGAVRRDEITLQTKLPGRDHGYDETRRSIEGSLERLGLEQIDLYVIHWPLPRIDKYVESFRAMIDARADGQLRSVGTSNFMPEHLQRVIDETGVTPALNQIQVSPDLPRDEWRAEHERMGVLTQAWSPIGGLHGLGDDTRQVFGVIAEEHGVSFGQAMLRWHTQQGILPIPRSSSPERQKQNLDVFGFDLTEQDFASVATLAKPVHPEWDPATHEEF